jgi:hypothetical protein
LETAIAGRVISKKRHADSALEMDAYLLNIIGNCGTGS